MAYFSRLILLCMLFFSSSVFAADGFSDGKVGVRATVYGVTYYGSTDEGVCLQLVPVFAAVNGRPVIFSHFLNGRCYYSSPDGSLPFTQNLQYLVCPEGKRVNFASWSCVDAPPPPPECPPAGEVEGSSSNAYTTHSRVPANNLCIGSCSWSAGGVVPSVCANGKCYYYGPFTSNGTSCTGEGGAPPPPEPDPAPPDDASCVSKGQCPGTINGTKICVPCSSKEGTTSESGSSSSSGTDSSGNPTGDTGTTNTTKETTANCTNGSCNTTTTTTVTNPDGSTSTTTETESTPQADFCKSNPGHIVCKGEDEGTWGGSCGSFVCTGDAVQCAQAEEAAALRCALTVDPGSPLIAAGEAAVTAASGVTTFGVSVPGFDSTNPYTGTCPVDVNVLVAGTSFTIPLSQTCPYIQFVGWCLVAAASLAGARIAFT